MALPTAQNVERRGCANPFVAQVAMKIIDA